jgi:hypothetical protein
LKSVERFEVKMTQREIWRRRASRCAGEAFLDGNIFESWAKKSLDHGNVLGAVVGHIKMASGLVWIEDTHLDHTSLSVETEPGGGKITQSGTAASMNRETSMNLGLEIDGRARVMAQYDCE